MVAQGTPNSFVNVRVVLLLQERNVDVAKLVKAAGCNPATVGSNPTINSRTINGALADKVIAAV